MPKVPIADKLVILQNVCNGLLVRSFHLMNTSRPELFSDNALKGVIAKLEKKPGNTKIRKISGFNKFEAQAQEILELVEEQYDTIYSVACFREECTPIFKSIAEQPFHMPFDVIPELCIRFMELITNLIKLHYIISLCDNVDLSVGVYNAAYTVAKGAPPTGLDIAVNFAQSSRHPFRMTQQMCEPASALARSLIDSIVPLIERHSSAESLRQLLLFNLMDRSGYNYEPLTRKQEMSCIFMQNAALIKHFGAFGLVAFPRLLNSENSLILLRYSLCDGPLHHFYRDISLNMFGFYMSCLDSFKSKEIKEYGVKVNPIKKVIRESEVHAHNNSAIEHFEMRVFLLKNLMCCRGVFQSSPGMVGPALMVAHTLLEMARSESLWMLIHKDWDIKQNRGIKFAEYCDHDNLPMLIHLTVVVTNTMKDYLPLSVDYYEKMVIEVDEPALQAALDSLPPKGKTEQEAWTLMGVISRALSSVDLTNKAAKPSIDGIRMDCFRVFGMLAWKPGSRNLVQPTQLREITCLVSRLVSHTRGIDYDGLELRKVSSLKKLFWYQHIIDEWKFFDMCLTQEDHQVGPAGCLSLMHVYAAGVDSCHRRWANEQPHIGAAARSGVSRKLEQIATEVAKHVLKMFQVEMVFAMDMEPISVMNYTSMIDNPEGGEQTGQQNLPGDESIYNSRFKASQMKQYQTSKFFLSRLSTALHNAPDIDVFDSRLNPSAFIRDRLAKYFRKIIVEMTAPKNGFLERPSVYMRRLECAMTAFMHVNRTLNIQLQTSLNTVLYEEFHCSFSGGASELPDLTAEPVEGSVGHKFVTWYATLVSKNLSEYRIVFSSVRHAFVTNGIPKGNPMRKFMAEDYLEIGEFKAFCTFAGPGGAKAMSQSFVGAIRNKVILLKQMMRDHQDFFGGLEPSCTMIEEVWWGSLKPNLSVINEFTNLMISIGILLSAREVLFEAVNIVIPKEAQLTYNLINGVQEIAGEKNPDPRCTSIHQLAFDCGASRRTIDESLRFALNDLCQYEADQFLWSWLPSASGICFVGPCWKSAYYLQNHEALTNNGHLLGLTLNVLIEAFFLKNLVGTDSMTIPGQSKQFLTSAAMTGHHMNSLSPEMQHVFQGFQRPSLAAVLDHFVSTSKYIGYATLENYIPYTVLRCWFTLAIADQAQEELNNAKSKDSKSDEIYELMTNVV
eukprot:191289_1